MSAGTDEQKREHDAALEEFMPLFESGDMATLLAPTNKPLLAKLYDKHRAEFEYLCDSLNEKNKRSFTKKRLDELRNEIRKHVEALRAKRRKERANVEGEDEDEFIRAPDTGKVIANKAHNIRLAVRKLGWEIRRNDFDGLTYVRQEDGGDWRTVDNDMLDDLFVGVDDDFDFLPTKDYFGTVLGQMARKNRYHPVREYLQAQVWDGKKRLHIWLHEVFGVEQNAYSEQAGILFFKALVARVMKPGCEFHEMLLPCGPQGLQKSTTLKAIMPRPEWFSDALPLHESDQKIMEVTQGKWLIEISDLKGNTRAETESVKAMLSKTHDKARMAYARLPQEVPRQFIITGTSNQEEPLSDPTGNRRYWPFKATKADTDWVIANRDQLFAEAYAEWDIDPNVRLDPQYYDIFRDVQASFNRMAPLETEIEALLARFPHGGVFAPTTLWDALGVRVEARNAHHGVYGTALAKLGWEKFKARLIKGASPVWAYRKGGSSRRIVVGDDGRLVYAGESFDEDESAEEAVPTVPSGDEEDL